MVSNKLSNNRTLNTNNVKELLKMQSTGLCKKEQRLIQNAGKWGYMFKGFYETTYKNIECGFELLLDLMNNMEITGFNVIKLKNLLYQEYTTTYKSKLNKIKDILQNEGKKLYIKMIYLKQLTLQDYIMSDDYFITLLDIWVISQKLNIPIIVISSTKLKENNKMSLILNGSLDDDYYIIKIGSTNQLSTTKKYPEYKLINYSDKINKIDISKLFYEQDKSYKSILDGSMNLLSYLDKYVMKKKLVLKITN